jgi:hypothetical protein
LAPDFNPRERTPEVKTGRLQALHLLEARDSLRRFAGFGRHDDDDGCNVCAFRITFEARLSEGVLEPILKIFLPKNSAKKLAILSQNKAKF